MGYAFLADAVLVLHGLFIVWALLGALSLRWRPWWALAHLPAAAWAVWVAWSGSYCPLTPLEQSLRRAAGQAGYEGGFIEHYLTRVIYPEGLTPTLQWAFGAVVLVINLALYGLAVYRLPSRRNPPETP
jgi:Protein of Unknown function (DUF2784)